MEIEKKPSASVQPGLVTGLLVSAMLTASLISVFYLAWKAAGLPFVPYDVFDWMTRILPGQVLTVGIGAMVTVIRALNIGPTAAGAKTAEHGMAIAGIFFANLIAGTILFRIIRALRGRYARTLGLALGIAVGVPFVLISHQVGQTASTGPALSAVWVLVAVLFWGATLGWAHQHLLADGDTVAKHAGDAIPPVINPQQWRLRIDGLVDKPLALTLDELQRFESMHQFVTLSCISNPVGGDLIGTTRWTGVGLQRLLPTLRLQAGATHLKIHAADGFYEVVSLETIRSDERVMLTYAWDGVPLLPEHGFPLRIYIPDLYGMKQPKWIESIEVTDHWEPGFWVDRGWDKDARMKATSVIDTVAIDMTIINADHRRLVPIGGIAHAGARGISRVELQIDDGPWQEAALRTPLSDLTWVVWRYLWPFDHGNHTFRVRCCEGNGTPQIATISPVEPSGATGLYSRTEMF